MEEEFLSPKLIEAEESNFQPNECGGREDDGVDRVSQLPDEILVDILSFLSLREAATTSVLSSRWSNLWKYSPNLNFNNLHDYDFELSEVEILSDMLRWNFKCKEIVNSVIKSHKALSLKTFKISLSLKKSDKWTVTKWFEFIFSRQVKSLELDFRYDYEEDQLVLGELLRDSRICLQPQTDLIFFQSLKSLYLQSLKVSGEDIELFLRNCLLLEKLKIRCTLTSDVELCGANLMLKHLDIFQCNGQKSIKVSAPNLCTMFVDEGATLFLEHIPKLVEAEFSFIMRPDIVAQHFASLPSCYFPQLQFLKFSLFDSKILFPLQQILANGFRQMPNLKKLDICCYYFVVPAIALIWTFPRLEEFEIMFGSSREKQPAAYMQDVMTDTGRSPHQHLKVFKLHMSLKQNVCDDIVELVTYLSNNCVALWKIIIADASKPNDPANMDYLAQQLQGKVANHIQVELS